MLSSRRRRVRAARRVVSGSSSSCVQRSMLCANATSAVRPGAVGVKLAGAKVRKCLVFDVCDDLFDDGVIAVLGLDERVGRDR
jgi:hypothetical protein